MTDSNQCKYCKKEINYTMAGSYCDLCHDQLDFDDLGESTSFEEDVE